MVFSLLRLGRHISKVPHAVIAGFSCGIGLMMIGSQQIGVLAVVVVLVACATAHWAPRIPPPLAGIACAVIVGKLLGLHDPEVGSLSLELPPFAGFSWSPSDVYTVIPSALALAVIASVNLLVTSRVVEHFRGRHRPLKAVDADTELGAYGIANVCAGMFGAPLSVGIPARSVASVRCGGRTRFANVFHAGIIVLCVSIGSDFLRHIPLTVLAGVIVYVGITLLEWSTWRRLARMRRVDAAAFLSTAVAVVTLNAVAAVAIGCSLYGLRWVWSRVNAHAPDELWVRGES
jgi:SulP family sulfate permease